MANEVLIAETSGDQRSIKLRGRNMPDVQNGGPSFGLNQRGRVNYPPGNPVADAALLGAVWKNTAIEGRWDAKFFDDRNAPVLTGFKNLSSRTGAPANGNARSPIELIEAFTLMCRSMQEIRFEWGPIVRYGVLWDFDYMPWREETWRWIIEFRWTGDTNVKPKVKKKPKPEGLGLLALLLKLLDGLRSLVAVLGFPAKLYNKFIKAPLDALTFAITDLLNELTKVVANAITPKKVLGDLRSSLTKIRIAANDLVRALNLFVAGFTSPMSERERRQAEVGVMVLSKEAIAMAAEMTRREKELAKLDIPEILAVAEIHEGETLRDLAQRVYGSAADWYILLQYNGLKSNVLPVGTRVLIPTKAAA